MIPENNNFFVLALGGEAREGGGGTQSGKGYRLQWLSWSGGCRDPRWLKKGGFPLIILYNRGAVRVCIQYSTSNNNCMHSTLFLKPFKSIFSQIHHLTLISRGCSWISMKRGGCKFGDGKTTGCPLSQKGGCSFAVGTPEK